MGGNATTDGAVARGRQWMTLAAAAMALAVGSGAARAAESVDLELILAVDCSFSVDDDEYRQQIDGLAEAFRDPEIGAAIAAGEHRRIAVSVVQWTGIDSQRTVIPWITVFAGNAAGFAARIANLSRDVEAGPTSITGLIRFALGHFAARPRSGARRILDISGDGRNNADRALEAMRRQAAAAGITINGLAILNEIATLDFYYRARVIAGEGAFVIPARDYDSYAEAIAAKLVREIGGGAIAGRRRDGDLAAVSGVR